MLAIAKDYGVIITQGPKNWEIIQQETGFAIIELKGFYKIENENGNEMIYARVLREDTREEIVPFTQCYIARGSWFISLQIPVGGPYIIETVLNNNEELPLDQSTRGDMIKHLGVGDVYLIAGQSNATGFGREAVVDAPELGVHCLYANGEWDIASHPLADSTGTLHPINREHMNGGVSPYLKLAKILHKNLGYPIGLIPTSKGGSALFRWNKNEVGDLYHNMLQVVGNRKLKGVLWYQGESDTFDGREKTYFERFVQTVANFRKDLHDEKLPFFTVQINKKSPIEPEREVCWRIVQEAQSKAAEDIPYVYMATSYGIDLSDSIHNNSEGNIVLGKRLSEIILDL